MLDAASPLPLYHQLADTLLEQIQRGSYEPGHKIPSEHALAESYGVGRPTVRQATDALIARGLLERKRGSGTFVRQVPVQHVDLFSLAGTLVSFERGGLDRKSRLLRRPALQQIEDPEHPLNAQTVTRVLRLSELDAKPVLLEQIDFAETHFPGLARLPLAGRSLSEVVQERYRMRPHAADQSFRVSVLDRAHARYLGLATGAPILQVDRTLHFLGAPSAVFARMWCRTDRLVFSQRLQGNSHA
jgi:GntR family transcriptional regulator